MRLVKTAIVAAALALPIAVVSVTAQGRGEDWHGPGRDGGHRGGYMQFLQGVDLTASQRDQLHQIVRAAWTQATPELQQLRALHKQISDKLASTDVVSEQSLQDVQDQAAKLREQLDAERLAVAVQVRGLLTPDQLAKSADVHQKLASLHDQERALLHPDGAR